ncbi:6-phosphogluconolactonase [bacterium]|nr:6-phosphogluconolactonase [bacterium]
MRRVVRVVSDPGPEALAEAAAEHLASCAEAAVADRGRFLLALSGGSTPLRMFDLLAREDWAARVPWERTWVLWADERCVPPEHPDSNYGAAHRTLLSRVPLAPERVLRMRGEDDPARAADAYECAVRELLGSNPRLDLVLLGMGADGHTASLFPGTEAVEERQRYAVANHVPQLQSWRLTLTLGLLNRSRKVLFLVSGSEKAGTLARVLEPGVQAEEGPQLLPAARVRPAEGELLWLVDGPAASALGPRGVNGGSPPHLEETHDLPTTWNE